MKIIDFERKGNVVRFYLGEKTKDWGWTNPDYVNGLGWAPDWLKPSDDYYGDDWDDVPYEHNAGVVYEHFVKGYRDVAFDFDDCLLEPCDGALNSPYCKDDMVARKVPCLIVVPKEVYEKGWSRNFEYWRGRDGVKEFYFGDDI